jgi:hypothetical protein
MSAAKFVEDTVLKAHALIDKLEDRVGYMRAPENWHKHPRISNLLCRLGRHDYELFAVKVDGNKKASADLICFYCGHSKNSTITPYDEN